MNRDDLKELTHQRLQDARVLLEHERFSAAYYLAGYVVECALKACIAKHTRQFDFPPERGTIDKIYVHDLAVLVKSAGLDQTLKADSEEDKEFDKNWTLAKDWSEKSRYQTRTKREAYGLLEAISNSEHGVLQWISRHW